MWPSCTHLRGVIKATACSASLLRDAGQARTRIVARRQPIDPVRAPRLREGDELVGPLTLSLLKPGQFNALRSRDLNLRIAPGAANLAVAVRDGGGRLLCVLSIGPSTFTPDEVFVLSDFAVAPTDYPRLSKLIVLAATYSESQWLCQRAFSRRIRRVDTTAYSNNPRTTAATAASTATEHPHVGGDDAQRSAEPGKLDGSPGRS